MASNPITWRNVLGRSLAEASRPLDSAGKFFDRAIQSAQGILTQAQGTEDANQKTRESNAQNAYLNLLQSARSPEQLASMAPELESARDALTPAAQAATRGAQDERLKNIRQGVIAEQQYADVQTERVEKPIVGGVEAQLARGDVAGARQAITDSALNPSAKARLERMATEVERGNITWDQSQTAFTWKEEQAARDEAAGIRAEASHEDQLKTNAARRNLIGIQGQEATAKLTETQQRAADAAKMRGAQDFLARASKVHQDRVTNATLAINSVAGDYIPPTGTTLPIGKDGHVDVTQMDSQERESFDNFLASKGVPTTSAIMQGDTAAAQETMAQLRMTGKYTPAELAQLEQAVPYAFSTTGMAPIGKELAELQRTQLMEEQISAENEERFGQISTAADRSKLLEAGTDVIGQLPEDLADHVRVGLAKYLREGGIEVGKGDDKTKIYMGTDELVSRILGTNFRFGNKGSEEVYQSLRSWDKTEAESAAALYKERQDSRTRKVQRFRPSDKK